MEVFNNSHMVFHKMVSEPFGSDLFFFDCGNEHRKCGFDRLVAYLLAAAVKMVLSDGDHTILGSRCNIDKTDGLCRCSAARSCNSRYGNGKINRERTHSTHRHLCCRFLGNGTDGRERFAFDTEEFFLDAIVIRNDTTPKNGRCARNIGNGGRNESSGTAFRRTEGDVLFTRKRDELFRKSALA